MRAWLIGILLVVGLNAGTIQNDEAFKSAVISKAQCAQVKKEEALLDTDVACR